MSNNSEVLALKYRPKRFEDLIGQETIAQTLSLALDSSRLSHAYLFSGLRGSGKTSTARIFAKALMCEHGPSSKPCDNCSHCDMANEGRHIDIIEMDAASSRKIDDIRDLIEHTKYKPATARFKIFIIDEVHMLTKEAFNALLKTLEEPPQFVKFILATTDPLKLPATILSRTQHFRFKKISTINVINHLSHIMHLENVEYQNEALEILARSGSGSLRDTLTLLDQAIIFSKHFVDVQTVTEMLGLVDPEFIDKIFKSIFAKNQQEIILHVKSLEDYEAEMVIDELIAYLKEKLYNSDSLFPALLIERFFRILSDAKSMFSINADSSFVLSLVFFKMVEALRIKEVDQMIEELEAQIQRPEIKTQETQDLPKDTGTLHKDFSQSEKIDAVSPVKQDTKSQTQKIVEVKEADQGKKYFKTLVENLNDRSADLGKCFSENITYIKFEENILQWESCAQEECKEKLLHGWGVIKHFVQDIFGFETKIKNLPCSKKKDLVEKVKEVIKAPTPTSAQMDAQPLEEPASMIEDEVMNKDDMQDSSCVSGCGNENTDNIDEASKEIDASSIMDEPMIRKAQEMFEATKITIQSKV